MKLLLFMLVVLIAAVSLALWVMQDPGYVLISAGSWSVETTLTLFVALVVVAFAAGYYLIRTTIGLKHVPRSLREWRQRRRAEKAQKALTHGLIELAEGQWQAAERDVLKYAGQGQAPLLNYLAAARAAQEQGADDRRDRYLKLAHENQPDADIAVGLTQVDLQLSQNQKEQALATLRRLHQLAPKHPQVLKALADLYRELGDWKNLLDLLPVLRKRKVFAPQGLEAMAREAHVALLKASGSVQELMAAWSGVLKSLREDETVLITYLQCLKDFGEDVQGEPLLRHALKHHRSDTLLRLYGVLKGPDLSRQLNQAESYLVGHETDATALLTAGRLCLRAGLWGKARAYLEASVQAEPSSEACCELATLLERLGEKDLALDYYRQGLRLTGGCESPVAAEVKIEHHPAAIPPPETAASGH